MSRKDYVKDDGESSFKYVHYWKPAAPDPDFLKKTTRTLVSSIEHLRSIAAQYKEVCTTQPLGFDTETTGLDWNNNQIVGFSFAYNTTDGFYVPLRHKVGTNLPIIESLHCFHGMLNSSHLSLGFNKLFDCRFLLRDRDCPWPEDQFKAKRSRIWDTALVCWLLDTNEAGLSLKEYEERYLGWSRDKFLAVLGDNADISYNDPKEVSDYASLDALGTINLFKKCAPAVKDEQMIIQLDQELEWVIDHMERTKVFINQEILQEDLNNIDGKIAELEQKVYQEFGLSFKIASPEQVRQTLLNLGINTGCSSKKTGKMSTGIDFLEKIQDRHAGIPLIIKYKQLLKLKGSFYASVLNWCAESATNETHWRFHTNRVPTGRLAASGEKGSHYYSPINCMAVAGADPSFASAHRKGDDWTIPQEWYPEKWDEKQRSEFKPKVYREILGWEFYDVPKKWCGPMVETATPDFNFLRAFTPSLGKIIVHVDVSSAELFVIANRYNVPHMIEAFKNKEDLHKKTALLIWGRDAYNNDQRRKAKVSNFSLQYGGTEHTLEQKLSLPPEQAREVFSGWQRVNKKLLDGQEADVSAARKAGFVRSYFGRPRRVRSYFASTDWRIRGYGDRTVRNHVIQGTVADYVRFAMVRIHRNLLENPLYADRCELNRQVHDSLDAFLDITNEPRFLEMCRLYYDNFFVPVKGWPLQLHGEFELGWDYGCLFPMAPIKNPDGSYRMFAPSCEEVLFNDTPYEWVWNADSSLWVKEEVK